MKLVIAGSRTFCCPEQGHDTKPDPICESCLNLARKVWRVLMFYTEFLGPSFHPIEIVSGRAKGADKVGELFAHQLGLAVQLFPAKWRVGERVNMAAGFERNQEMADYADAAVLFWDGKSKGTQDMRQRMKRLRKPCVLYNFTSGKIE